MADKKDALVGNASDPEQVAEATKKEKITRRSEMLDLQSVLSTKQGRRFIWRILDHCNTFGSVFSPNAAIMGHLSGKQDVGHFLVSEINKAQPEALIEMMKAQQETTQ